MDAYQRFKAWAKAQFRGGGTAVDEADVERTLHEVAEKLPRPVFWLLGKTQAGKSSLIRNLTGSTAAEIGEGFRACTKTARIFSFPDEEEPLVRFLDTRGLGEAAYDPAEDLRQFADQSHLLLVVMKATDHAQQPVVEALRKIRAVRGDWPIVVAQTGLHEGYPTHDAPHVLPYPYHLLENGPGALPPEVPGDLVRSILKQRELFAGLDARFVPLDFTLPEDGFDPPDYGIEYLWETIDTVLPLGLGQVLAQSPEIRNLFRDRRFRTAHKMIVPHALAAGAAALVPVPLVDMPVVVSIQMHLCYRIAEIYEQPMDRNRLLEIAGGMGIGWLGRFGVRELAKLIPWVGAPLAGAYAAASTYALGRTLCAYFVHVRRGDVPDPQMFRKMFAEQEVEGRRVLQVYLDRMTNLRAKTAKPGPAAAPASAENRAPGEIRLQEPPRTANPS